MEKQINKQIYRYIREILLVLIMLVSSLFIWESPSFGNIEIISYKDFLSTNTYIEDISSGINLVNAYPTKDEEGLKEEGYTFRVVNNSDVVKEITICLINNLKDEDNALAYRYIRYQVLKDDKIIVKPTNISDDGILFTDKIDKTSTYELKMWLDFNSDIGVYGKTFSTKIALL